MGPYSELPESIDAVDVIIAGGGTAGCVVASRLAEADPTLSILVIEAGPDNYNNPTIVHPAFFITHLMPDSKTTSFYRAKRSQHLADREVVVPCGRVLGGGSSINMMMYSRPQRSDFDDWEMPGWSARDMIPLLKKLETYHGKGDLAVHGDHGPIHVSGGTFRGTKSETDFIRAVNQVGWPEFDDVQNLDNNNGAQRAMRLVSPNGKRQDAAHQYLHPLLRDGKHPNLHVVCESQVDRVLLENKKAVGVFYRRHPAFTSAETSETRFVRARKLVIISCGAFGTPLILERSGIGDPGILKCAGVALIADLPGVGRNYQDHQLGSYAYKTNLAPEDTLDAVVQGRIDPVSLVERNSPLLGYNGQDVACKLRPTDDEVTSLGPGFQQAWDEHFRAKPDKPLVLMSLINCFPGIEPGLPPGQYLGLTAFSVYPFSRGHVHISGKSIDDTIDFDTGFFADPNSIDLKKHFWAYKKQREIMRRMNCYRGEYAPWHPPFLADSPAACIEADGPPVEDLKNIEYTAEDDVIIETFLRERVSTTWHSLGTCKMAPRDKQGVVSPHLDVYDVQNLKIVDLSVVPKNVGANTNFTALAIGEKAAEIVIDELKLGGSQVQ